MRPDHYTKVAITVIAVCLTALTLAEIGLPDLLSDAEATIDDSATLAHQKQEKSPGAEAGLRAPTSTLPLRWRIPKAAEVEDADATSCSTLVGVRNLTTGTVNVDVEWITWEDITEKLRPMALPAGQLMYWATNDVIRPRPYWDDDDADITFLLGYANVNSDDPRILVTATILCRDGIAAGAKIVSQNEVSVFPIGATAEYFQAGMPTTWTPPMAVPEVPE